MSTHDYPIAIPIRGAGAGSRRLSPTKSVALEAAHTFTEMARNALFAYAMTAVR